jgi:arylsulfatase A-like enzyme/tetratricopeptide (TPR) repeat protein
MVRVGQALLPVLACCALGLATAAPPVILISVDTLRADRLSCYSSRGLRTPNIDALAKGGTLFSQAAAQVPLTLPSHVSLLTSTYPFSNGIQENGEQLGPNAVTLAKLLKSSGYRTAAFVGGFVLDRRFGLDQDFDFYDSPFDLHRKQGVDPGDVKRSAEEVVRAAVHWLEANSSKPFFVFLHLYDLHTPYDLPRQVRSRFRGSGYEAELGYVDEVLAGFWKLLYRRGLFNKTLIIFTSDHGEALGEHKESTHGYFIYQSTLRVPLIFHWPDGAGDFKTQVDEPVSLLDVAPTILQFGGVPQPREMQGRSLLALVAQNPPNQAEEVYGESYYGRHHFGCAVLRSLRLGRYKYIEAPKPEFYDLSRDPGETDNLYARERLLANKFRQRLLVLRSRFQASGPVAARMQRPEVAAALRSLGYLAGGALSAQSRASGADPKDRIPEFEDYGRALVLASSGRLVEANARLEELLAKLPEVDDIRISLGLNQQKLGRQAEAAKTFKQIVQRSPLNLLAHFNLAVALFRLNQLEDAAREAKAALAIAPYYTRADELLGAICLQKNDLALARERFIHILTIAPDDYAAHYNLGALAVLEGTWEQGERHLRAALRIDPEAVEAYNTLGSLYLRSGDLEKARLAFEQAIRLAPKLASAHYNLGLVFRRQARNEEAARKFQEALAADPQFQAARAALSRMAK